MVTCVAFAVSYGLDSTQRYEPALRVTGSSFQNHESSSGKYQRLNHPYNRRPKVSFPLANAIDHRLNELSASEASENKHKAVFESPAEGPRSRRTQEQGFVVVLVSFVEIQRGV